MRTSCIAHPANTPLVMVRADYLALLDGDACAAAILNVFEYWTNVKLAHRGQAEIENAIAEAGGEAATQNTGLWIYKSQRQLQEEDLLGVFGEKAVARGLETLEQIGFIEKRRNPRYKWDRTYQYRLNAEAVQTALDAGSIPQNDTIDERDLPVRRPPRAEAIPEITTEITTEDVSPPASRPVSPAPEKPADWPYSDFWPTPQPGMGWPDDTPPQVFTAPSGGTKATREAFTATCSACQGAIKQTDQRCSTCGFPVVWLNSLPYKDKVVKPWQAAQADAKAKQRREGEQTKLSPGLAYLYAKAIEAPAVLADVHFKKGERERLEAYEAAHGPEVFKGVVDKCRAKTHGRALIQYALNCFAGGYLGMAEAKPGPGPEEKSLLEFMKVD